MNKDQNNAKTDMSRRKALATLSTAGMALLSAPFLSAASSPLPVAVRANDPAHSDGIVNIVDFGAIGDGKADDTAAIQAALHSGAGSVLIPVGDYRITSTLTVPDKVTLRGIGRLSRLLKYFNGDMVLLQDTAKLIELEIDGRGKSFSGRGVVIDSGTNQKILDCSIVNTLGYCVEFSVPAAGKISTIDKCLMYTLTPANLPAIKLPESEQNGDRKIISVDCGGGLLADFGGCSTVLVTNCNTIGVIFKPASKKVSMIGNRIAGGTAGINVEISGLNHTIIGNISATPFYIMQDCDGSVIMGNVAKIVDQSRGKNKVDSDTPGITLSNNYGGFHADSSYMVLGAGGTSPNAGSISFGDGTGWKLNIGTSVNKTFVPKFTFYDKGCLRFEPMNANHAAPGSVFTDTADKKLKYKDETGLTMNLGGSVLGSQPNSTASDIASLRNDFNALLSKMKASGLMRT
ncbi:hypothetical protein FE784_09135 [Paenibacillus hemerocallicola]|uniref:Rhamnogalacturonase A/B/Epimerase-like pectate lyase domain-containing protein n=1 Tax=Paenibacillus hemerocallicola TaxID=1172614 RepID=A0A5C4TE46_9BACL|nr:glycosyl hydrolase family 28-related protein [Paenibacillus hemerocallicola]TNJ66719.1 hypothetical protein FE784_09135 [Paenibacillus hemerocallicola]